MQQIETLILSTISPSVLYDFEEIFDSGLEWIGSSAHTSLFHIWRELKWQKIRMEVVENSSVVSSNYDDLHSASSESQVN